ncbi:hypothetical protein [Nocardiopsis alba]|uniref:hypothetical protein n=1 Tax=Nocardiopsis alba TaxID=53437 RepID=UPI0035DA71D8
MAGVVGHVLKTGRPTGPGRSMADAALATGGRFVCAPGFAPEQVCASIAEHRAARRFRAENGGPARWRWPGARGPSGGA